MTDTRSRTPEQRAAHAAYMREYWAKPENSERRNSIRRERRRTDPEYAEHVRELSRARLRRYQATEKGKEAARRSQRARQARLRGAWLSDPCFYCGEASDTVDHIVPLVSGGTDSWDNKTPACAKCNQEKGDKSLLMFLLQRAS